MHIVEAFNEEYGSLQVQVLAAMAQRRTKTFASVDLLPFLTALEASSDERRNGGEVVLKPRVADNEANDDKANDLCWCTMTLETVAARKKLYGDDQLKLLKRASTFHVLMVDDRLDVEAGDGKKSWIVNATIRVGASVWTQALCLRKSAAKPSRKLSSKNRSGHSFRVGFSRGWGMREKIQVREVAYKKHALDYVRSIMKK